MIEPLLHYRTAVTLHFYPDYNVTVIPGTSLGYSTISAALAAVFPRRNLLFVFNIFFMARSVFWLPVVYPR